ncbi:hypothetical protein [Burkholderia glumae]
MTNNTTASALTDEQRAAINMAISVLTPLAMDEYGDALRALLTSPRAAGLPAIVEAIAAQWDGCIFEGMGDDIDIGTAIRDAYKRLDAAPAAPVAPVAEPMLKAPEGEDPMADGQNTVESGLKRLRAAYCKQQAAPIPDQMALVWRADVMRLALDYGRLATLVKKHIPDAHIAAPSAAQAVAADGADTDELQGIVEACEELGCPDGMTPRQFISDIWSLLIAWYQASSEGKIAVSDPAYHLVTATAALMGDERAAVSPATAALPIKIPHVHIRPEDEEIGRQYYALGFVDGNRSITDAPQPARVVAPKPATADSTGYCTRSVCGCEGSRIETKQGCYHWRMGAGQATADERAAFEAWRKTLMARPNLMRDGDYYEDYDTQIAWSGFQAGHASQAAAPAHPQGTFACPICGKETPHEHTSQEIAEHRSRKGA